MGENFEKYLPKTKRRSTEVGDLHGKSKLVKHNKKNSITDEAVNDNHEMNTSDIQRLFKDFLKGRQHPPTSSKDVHQLDVCSSKDICQEDHEQSLDFAVNDEEITLNSSQTSKKTFVPSVDVKESMENKEECQIVDTIEIEEEEEYVNHKPPLVAEETDEDELEDIFEQSKLHFPTEQEIKNAKIYPVSTLIEDHVYFVLHGKKSKVAYENDDGNVERGDSIILKVVDTKAKSHLERVNIRLTGIPYEMFVDDSRWDTYSHSDEYFIIYEGLKESKINAGHFYHRISVLHRQRGTKQFRVDGAMTKKSKRKTFSNAK